jgi:acylpyruvate hydrolase
MKIICIGRNYAEHAKELNNPLPTEPVFFMKPDTALLTEGAFYIPDFTQNVHYECELVLRIKKVGKHIPEKFALDYVDEIGLGIDFTARDLQDSCKEKGLPWEKAKAFDHSAPIGKRFIPLNKEAENITFRLEKNGQLVQTGHTKDMIFNFAQVIAYVSQYVTLRTGDYIYTGTPSGVGPVAIGDKLTGYLEGEKMFEFEVK